MISGNKIKTCRFAEARVPFTFQTDSDEDVIFVSEKSAAKSRKVPIDQVKLLALQRDIDQESVPKQQTGPLQSQRFALEKVKMKTKEEKSEEDNQKKGKKHKKEKASLLNTGNCNPDDGRSADVKKEKKNSKKVGRVETMEESIDGCDLKEEKKKKKKKVNEFLNDANSSDVSKKKKGIKNQCPDPEEEAEVILVEEEEIKQRKKKKKKSENVKVELEEKEILQPGKDKTPKKSKKDQNGILVANKEESDEPVKEKIKKKKKTPEETNDENKEVKVKKKKEKTKERSDVESAEVKGDNSKMSSGKNTKDKLTMTETFVIKEEKIEFKSKVKKEKKRKVEESEMEETEPKKKKKGKKAKGEEEEQKPNKVIEEAEEVEQSKEGLVPANKKSKRTKMESNTVTEDGRKTTKKKKIKEEAVEEVQEPPQTDVLFLSEKSGNTDEITINQERRQALQEEIDKASQPNKPATPSGFGQWSTAQFDSSAQQQKFLRLMGGYKKAFQPAAASGGGANMAMGKQAQQQLQQGLLGEFERAQSRRMDFGNRGAGLGFAAPSNKKFSIDVNTRRSVRFDD